MAHGHGIIVIADLVGATPTRRGAPFRERQQREGRPTPRNSDSQWFRFVSAGPRSVGHDASRAYSRPSRMYESTVARSVSSME